MYLNEELNCCGLREISGLSDHRTAMTAMKDFAARTVGNRDNYFSNNKWEETFEPHTNWRYAIFSAAKGGAYGRNFAAYILAHKLGEVIETGTHINPNSKNPLKVWVWTVDWDAVTAWAKANKIKVGAHGERVENS